MNSGEEDHRGKVPLPSYHIKRRCCQRDLVFMLTSITQLRYVCRVFPLPISSFLFPFPHCGLWKEVTMGSPHVRDEKMKVHL